MHGDMHSPYPFLVKICPGWGGCFSSQGIRVAVAYGSGGSKRPADECGRATHNSGLGLQS